MVKKISTLALVGLLALPAMASAGAGGAAAASDIQAQVDALTRQLEQLKAEMAKVKAAPAPVSDQSSRIQALEEKSEQWDLASRIQFSGDFRSRYDYYTRDRKPTATTEVTDTNNALMTNRFRMDMRAKALEDVEFKGRLAMYKAWGMQDAPGTPGDAWGGFPAFDGTSGRQVADSALLVDRAFLNWNNIGGAPVWFSIGRRPTTDGPPAQLKLNMSERMATPTAVMDWPFDGVSVGYAYNNLFGMQDAPGRVRFCWGKGFEAGLQQDNTGINDTDFAGISWDIYKKANRFAYVQSFVAMDVFNFPDFVSETEDANRIAGMGGRKNLGNIYHTSGVYQDKYENLNYFGMLGWSHTDPNEVGIFNPGDGTVNTGTEDGYLVHVGVRYDIPQQPFKIGAEYNHGSRYWIGMTPGHDDQYAAKLATRGNAYEVYGIYDIPGGEAISKFGSAFIRFGYVHYDYDYSGGMDWNFKPADLNNATEVATAIATGNTVVTSADQVYVTFEATF